jgi:hypothetical protein
MEHVPISRIVTLTPETVQTVNVLETKLTGNPEDAVATSVTFPAP